jgi:hypothetical protein
VERDGDGEAEEGITGAHITFVWDRSQTDPIEQDDKEETP